MKAVSKNLYFHFSMIWLINTIAHIIKILKLNPSMLSLLPMLSAMLNFMKKDPKFQVGDHVRISKYKHFLLKDIL